MKDERCLTEVKTKVCRMCHKEKPTTEFYFRRDNMKLRNDCRECVAVQHRKYYAKHQEKIRKNIALYRAENREKITEINKKRYRLNINGRRTKALLRLNPNYFKVLKRDCYVCQLCKRADSKDSRLLIHHLNGNREDNKMKNLITLCTPCHNTITWLSIIPDGLKKAQKILTK